MGLFPDTYSTQGIGSIRSIRDFDERIPSPYSGFEGADDYYFRASSGNVVSRIEIPTLVLYALDDPFIRITAETRETLLRNSRRLNVWRAPRWTLRLSGHTVRQAGCLPVPRSSVNLNSFSDGYSRAYRWKVIGKSRLAWAAGQLCRLVVLFDLRSALAQFLISRRHLAGSTSPRSRLDRFLTAKYFSKIDRFCQRSIGNFDHTKCNRGQLTGREADSLQKKHQNQDVVL